MFVSLPFLDNEARFLLLGVGVDDLTDEVAIFHIVVRGQLYISRPDMTVEEGKAMLKLFMFMSWKHRGLDELPLRFLKTT